MKTTKKAIMLRVTEDELEIIKRASEAEKRSINSFGRFHLVDDALKILQKQNLEGGGSDEVINTT